MFKKALLVRKDNRDSKFACMYIARGVWHKIKIFKRVPPLKVFIE